MKTTALVLLLTLMIPAATASAQWEWIYPTLQGHDLYDVAFLDEDTAIAVGPNTVLTHDAGLTWTFAEQGPGYCVAAVDASTAVAVWNDWVSRTTDQGATWQAMRLNMLAGSDIDFAGNTGLIAANPPHRSTDGGATWVPVTLSFYGMSRAVCFATPSIAYLGTSSGLFRSEDAGLTWSQIREPGFDRLSFADASNGAASTFGGMMWLTGDGGTTWSGSPLNARDIEMVNPNVLLAAGASSSGGQFLLSSDRGQSWTSYPTPRTLNAVARNRAGIVLAVGSGGTIHRFTPPGTWTQVAGATFPHLANTTSEFAGQNHGIVAGWTGSHTTLLRTADGGATWQTTDLIGTRINDLVLATGGREIHAAGQQQIGGVAHSAILKSRDRGETWSLLWSGPENGELLAMAFSSPNRGIAVGRRGSFVLMDGDRFIPGLFPESTRWDFRDVAFADHKIAVAVGNLAPPPHIEERAPGVVARTTDGGQTWELVPVRGLNQPVRAIAFASKKVGVAGAGTDLIRTEDAGATWEAVGHLQGNADILDVAFATPQYGIAVGNSSYGGSETNDGGLTWTPLPQGVGSTRVSCFAPFNAIMTGDGPMVLKYTGSPSSKSAPSISPVASEPEHAAVLLPNHPNPFNPSTTIRFVVPGREHVRLAVFDAAGRHVITLVDDVRGAGTHAVQWNGRNARGETVASGVYLSRMETGGSTSSRKLVLLK